MEIDAAAVHEDSESMDQDMVQHDIDKWVEFYDELKAYLQHGSVVVKSSRNIRKAAENFTLGGDGNVYRKKTCKDGSMALQVLVIRNYEDRLRIVKDIHVNTGDEARHHRRDKMLELVGQQYYWKGQRRDICECIASCEVCSVGLGGIRYSKPPGQARDVRPPTQLQKLSLSPLTVSSPIATATRYQPALTTQSSQTGGLGSGQTPLGTARVTVEVDAKANAHGSNSSPPVNQPYPLSGSSSAKKALNSITIGPLTFELPNLMDSSQSSNEYVPTSSESSAPGLQPIFTTIAAPDVERFDISCMDDGGDSLTATTLNSSASAAMQLLNTPSHLTAARSNSVTHSASSLASEPESISGYHRLFQLPSQPNTSLSPPVIDAMQIAMKESVDPVQLAEAAGIHVRQTLALTPGFSVLVAPSRAAAYTLALAASMIQVDPLSVDSRVSRPSPLAVIHDAYCLANSPDLHPCSALLGAITWSLGAVTSPMDNLSLSAAIASNRIAAVFHQPHRYPEGTQHTPLAVIGGICHARERLSVIVDADGFPIEPSLVNITTAVREWCERGADFIMLPRTEKIQGPPETCVLVGQSALLKKVDLALLQPRVCLPLTCSAYDLVGTVMAYKTLR